RAKSRLEEPGPTAPIIARAEAPMPIKILRNMRTLRQIADATPLTYRYRWPMSQQKHALIAIAPNRHLLFAERLCHGAEAGRAVDGVGGAADVGGLVAQVDEAMAGECERPVAEGGADSI